ncbi:MULTISPECIES: hypothetical protein [unclassified Rossellomorea]|uniref:hypothetical protein n=1 Tax=unclassified Rossellomorea TaxID=2837526 RepID=UPI00261A3E71|nr:hypothetical protein [uncultured Rossellomorea sp.]
MKKIMLLVLFCCCGIFQQIDAIQAHSGEEVIQDQAQMAFLDDDSFSLTPPLVTKKIEDKSRIPFKRILPLTSPIHSNDRLYSHYRGDSTGFEVIVKYHSNYLS